MKYYLPNADSKFDGCVFYVILNIFGYCIVKVRNINRFAILKRSVLSEHIDI